MNSIGFMRWKASGWMVTDWFVFGVMSSGKGTLSQTMPPRREASM